MSKNINNKNLSDLEIGNIELYLNAGFSPAEIGRKLDRDPSGIRKEIKNYAFFTGIGKKCVLCVNKEECNVHYLCNPVPNRKNCSSCKYCKDAAKKCFDFKVDIDCELLKKRHICNGCERQFKCKITYTYNAYNAIIQHKAKLNESHVPLKIENLPDSFKEYLAKKIKDGISPEIIVNRLPKKFEKYRIVPSSLYKYIDLGLLDCCNLDLRNKVSRVDYGSNTIKRNTIRGHHLNGRSIENLSDEDKKCPLGVAEMDTVEGIKGGAVLLTIMIPKYSLMLAYKMKAKSQEEVKLKLDILEFKLGPLFYTLFKTIIPDNGSEFTNYEYLESSIHKNQTRCHVYYTHSYASYEKPHVENNHILLRWLIKKGFDIGLISEKKLIEIIDVLNNYPRPLKGYKTPIELIEEDLGSDIIRKLGLKKIPYEKLNLHISLKDDETLPY